MRVTSSAPAALHIALLTLAAAAIPATVGAQSTLTADPFPDSIPRTEGALRVSFAEFAVLPDLAGVPARMMLLVDEPGTQRLFVNDMRGALYRISYDGRSVIRYLDVNAPRWGTKVQSQGRERGFQSFAFHPQFAEQGAPGFGKLYTWTDTEDVDPASDYQPGGGDRTHHTVLHEWTARNPASAVYDGAAPRELLRLEQPFANHNGGRIAFDPLARPGDSDYGLLYVGVADGGSGGDPLGNAQSLSSPFGKILRIDPLGRDHDGKYGIPAGNPFAADPDTATLGEIFASGIRNAQHFAWDAATGRMIVTDIGQSTVEELDVVTAGANLGWNAWEGSFRYGGGGVDTADPRSDPEITYPFVEYDHTDPLLLPRSAITGLAVYRSTEIAQLQNTILFGDLPSGEMFWVPADDLPSGGQAALRRVLLEQAGQARTLLEVIQEKNRSQGRAPATRADLRLHPGPQGRVFLLDKADGVIRVLVPDGGSR